MPSSQVNSMFLNECSEDEAATESSNIFTPETSTLSVISVPNLARATPNVDISAPPQPISVIDRQGFRDNVFGPQATELQQLPIIVPTTSLMQDTVTRSGRGKQTRG